MNTCDFDEGDVMKACEAQTDDQVAECMKAWRKRGNAMTCVRCRDCTSSECTMYCSNAAHPEAPLRRMDCVDGEDCGDSLESGNHDSIFSNTYNRAEAIAKGEALDKAADTRNAKFRGESCASKSQADCTGPCEWNAQFNSEGEDKGKCFPIYCESKKTKEECRQPCLWDKMAEKCQKAAVAMNAVEGCNDGTEMACFQ